MIKELDDKSETECSHTLVIEPSIEEATVDTDCDSDSFDNEVTSNPEHLPKRILLTKVLSNDLESEPTEKSEVTKKPRKEKIAWHKNSKEVTNIVGDFSEHTGEDIITSDCALECIGYFWKDEWVKFICDQSKIYAHQKSLPHTAMTKMKKQSIKK